MPACISCAADVSWAKTSVEAPIARMMQAQVRRARPRQHSTATLRNQVLLAFIGIGILIARTNLVRADRVEGHLGAHNGNRRSFDSGGANPAPSALRMTNSNLRSG